MSEINRAHDIVVFGATGFVGALTAAHLAGHAPAGTRLALAGRNAERLAAVRDRLGLDWPIITADAYDEEAMAGLAAATRVVLTTAGPYARYGVALAAACAAAGTHYADLTGETPFVRASADDNHELATSTGARIVHSCGFDAVPSDLGVHVLHAAVAADGAGELTDTTMVVSKVRAGISGGTIDSFKTLVDTLRGNAALRRLMADPYALSPARADEPDLGREPDMALIRGASVDPAVRGTLAPFVMGAYNTRVVRRSNALRGWAYGRTFRYREALSVGTGPLSPVLAAATTAGIGAFVGGLALPPTRYVLDRVLPKPGDGPSEKMQRTGHFTIDLYTRTTTGARYTARFKAQGDPGYAATAVMLGEAGLALALGGAALPSGGGVLTPATGIGDAYVDRLRAAGMEIQARRTD